jgi:hypothetical protein
MAHSGTKTTKTRQARMIAALLDPRHRSQEAACEAAGVPLRTLHNWLRDDPEFIASLRRAESEAITLAMRRLTSVAPDAVAVIVSIMIDPKTSASVRLRAAGQVLDTLQKLRELHEFEARLAALEDRYRETGTLAPAGNAGSAGPEAGPSYNAG